MVQKDGTWLAMMSDMETVREELKHMDSENPCVAKGLVHICSALAYARGKQLEWE